MKTKIAYILSSSEKDYYLEQTMISVCSLKFHNPNCYAILVIDNLTNKSMQGARRNIMHYFDELKVIDVPTHFNKVQSSRFIKTSLRNHIDGDYLFIDGDTIICDDISEIDNFCGPIAAVLDCHMPISKHQHQKLIRQWAKDSGWIINDDNYYNSGVMFVSDSKVSHDFYDLWHKKWLENSDKGFPRDQPTMGMVNEFLDCVVNELSGQWNCQIFDNGIKYFTDAKIVHYFSSRGAISHSSPFVLANNEILVNIRENSYVIPHNLMSFLYNRHNLLSGSITLIGREDAMFYYTTLSHYLKKMYICHPNLYEATEKLLVFVRQILGIKNSNS